MQTILHSARLSISVNGKVVGYFSYKRGVRQEDLLSRLLFCIVEDVFSRDLSQLVAQNKLLPMSSPRLYKVLSHVLYANDILIFCRGTKRNLDNLMSLFQLYSAASGQVISLDKSKYYASAISPNRLHILTIWDFLLVNCLLFILVCLCLKGNQEEFIFNQL